MSEPSDADPEGRRVRIERSEDRSESGPSDNTVRLTAWVHGHVQGVGFRWWTRARALELGLVGHATNQPDGRVLVVAEGPGEAVDSLLRLLRGDTTPGRVELVVDDTGPAVGGLVGFVER